MCTAAFGSGLHGFQRGAFREDPRIEDGRGQREEDEASVGDNYFTPRRKLGRTAGWQRAVTNRCSAPSVSSSWRQSPS